jgi:hypothetical protein
MEGERDTDVLIPIFLDRVQISQGSKSIAYGLLLKHT